MWERLQRQLCLAEVLSLGCVIIASSMARECESANAPSATALLRGAESALLQFDTLRVELSFKSILPHPPVNLDCIIEMQGGRRRFESTGGARYPRQITLIEGDEVKSFEHSPGSSVRLFGMKYETATSGDLAFDPRTLGLTDLLAADTTVEACIWKNSNHTATVVGKEKINGVEAWRVHVATQTATSDYWIEEPGFRIHQRTVEWSKGKSTIHSEFGDQDRTIPFPRIVSIKRQDKNGLMDRQIEVRSVDTQPELKEDRFSLASFDLPINTMAIDYRTQRVVGYWNGTGLSESPYYPNSASDTAQPSSALGRLGVIVANVAVIAVIVSLIWWRRQYTR